jgi:RHS repeat-associated protein
MFVTGVSPTYDYTFSYDDMGRFETIEPTGGSVAFQYHYDAASNEVQRDNVFNGVQQIYPRDNLNRMLYVDLSNGLSHEGYIYNAMNRLTSVTRQGNLTDSFTYYLDGELNTTHYDSTNRSVNYALDKAGNRTSVMDNVNGYATYTPNAINQYINNVGPDAITNDVEHEIASYQNVSYTYINDGRLSSVASGSNTYTLAYDALGRCVKRSLNGATTYYIYDGEKPILEYNGAGGQVGFNLYGKGIDEIIERGANGTDNQWHWYYPQQDHEGSVTHLTDASGAIIERYRYDAFGAPTIYAPNWSGRSATIYDNRFLFTGREYAATYRSTYNAAFKFYEYRARAYHTGLGRFTSEDPKLFDAGDYNLFRYCHNDPLDLTDPMGLEVGFGESLIPVWGSGHMAYDAFNEGLYGMAAFHTAMAITDVTGVKALGSIAAKAALKGAAKVAAERAAIKVAQKTAAEKEGGLVIGKLKDVSKADGWRTGDHTPNLPERGSTKANWQQNSSELRAAENNGKPIRDVSTDANGNLRDNSGFLKAERNLLENRGRIYDPKTNSWIKPEPPKRIDFPPTELH